MKNDRSTLRSKIIILKYPMLLRIKITFIFHFLSQISEIFIIYLFLSIYFILGILFRTLFDLIPNDLQHKLRVLFNMYFLFL